MKPSANFIRFGFWLRAGIISAGVVAVAVMRLLGGEGALATTFAVGLLAAVAMVWSWRRASRLLSALDEFPATVMSTKRRAKPEPAPATRVRDLPMNIRVPMPERP